MSDTVIRAEHLSKRYQIGARERYKTLRDSVAEFFSAPFRRIQSVHQTIWALKDVSFEIKKGEVVGIIGRNGAGKTTLLKILSRITAPTEGSADIYGRVSPLLEVGTGFHPELTGRDNIYLNGAILGMKRAEISRKFDEIVSFAELDLFIDTPVKRYSSGMYLRLAFSVAAHLEPEILLVDEVLAVGDAAFQKKCLGKMHETAKEGRTVLFVSHNMSAVARLCSRAILLESGRRIKDGPVTEVITSYLNEVVETDGSRTWSQDSAPGTDELKLVSLKLLKENNAPASVVEVGESLKLRIGYHVRKPNLRFRCVALFFTQGVCAFASMEPRETTRPDVGRYYSTVVIPPHLLSEGEYIVGISIFASRGVKNHYVHVKDALAFQVVDPMIENSARGDYAETIGGVVRPLLEWQMSFDGADGSL